MVVGLQRRSTFDWCSIRCGLKLFVRQVTEKHERWDPHERNGYRVTDGGSNLTRNSDLRTYWATAVAKGVELCRSLPLQLSGKLPDC